MNDAAEQPGNREIVEYRADSLVRDISELMEMRLNPSFAHHIKANQADLDTALSRLQLLCSHVRVCDANFTKCVR